MLENKIKDALTFFKNNNSSRIKIIIAIGLIGIVLIAMSDLFSSGESGGDTAKKAESVDCTEYAQSLEGRLTDVISSIDGVGECKVMITLENSKESVYATDGETKTGENDASNKEEYVIYDSENGETPVLIKEYYPKIQGVTVVCSGGDNIVIKETVINTVTSLFGISANRVSVSKIKE